MTKRIRIPALVALVALGAAAAARAQETADPVAGTQETVATAPARVATTQDEVAPMTPGGNVPDEAIQDPGIGLDLIDENQVPGAAARRAKHQEVLARWQAAGPEERQAIMAERLAAWNALSSEQRVSVRNRWKVRWHQMSLAERDAFKEELAAAQPAQPPPRPGPPPAVESARRPRNEVPEAERGPARPGRFERRRMPERFQPRLSREDADDDDDD